MSRVHPSSHTHTHAHSRATQVTDADAKASAAFRARTERRMVLCEVCGVYVVTGGALPAYCSLFPLLHCLFCSNCLRRIFSDL